MHNKLSHLPLPPLWLDHFLLFLFNFFLFSFAIKQRQRINEVTCTLRMRRRAAIDRRARAPYAADCRAKRSGGAAANECDGFVEGGGAERVGVGEAVNVGAGAPEKEFGVHAAAGVAFKVGRWRWRGGRVKWGESGKS